MHTVALHEARQSPGESTKAFAARVRGIATNCNLVKTCECSKTVSFLDETVYHVVLAGLHDSDMQERALSAAILKTITDTASLVEFCSAEESGRKCTPTVAGFRGSTFQRNKHLRDQPVPQVNPPVTCHLSHHDVISVEGGPTVAICSFLQIYIANLSHSFRLLEEDEPLNVEEATLDLANAAPGNKGRQRVTDQVRIRIV